MRDAFFQKLEQHVSGLFDEVRLRAEASGEEFIRTPYTDELVLTRDESLFPLFQCGVHCALAARESFQREAPPDVPELPLASVEYEKLIRSKSGKFALVGYFARSWACANWGPHLSFYDYCYGVMASSYTPKHIRTDPALLKEFPPKPFGRFDKSLCWAVRERIFDFTQQLMRTEKNWRRSGMANDAKWMRGVIERLTKVELDEKLRNFLDSQPPC